MVLILSEMFYIGAFDGNFSGQKIRNCVNSVGYCFGMDFA
jgi:hypothetical protein